MSQSDQPQSAASQHKRIVIVGGVAGGASAAARARRLSETAEIVLLERGEHVSFANCGLPYHIAGTIPDRAHLLVQTAEGLRRRYAIDVRIRHEAIAIDRAARTVQVRDLKTGLDAVQPYDVLILSPGAAPVRPPIPGADGPLVFTLRNLWDMDRIKKVLDEKRPPQAVVVGGGYIGLEMAEALRHRGVGVTLVEMASHVFQAADPEMVTPIHQHLELHGVKLRLGLAVTAISQDDPSADAVRVRLSSGEELPCGLVIMAIGVKPEVQLARDAGLEIGAAGGILVDNHMRTSDPAVFAVGDAIEVNHLVGGHQALIPLAGPANRQGRIAADNALGLDSVYRDSQGTAICKVFDLAIAMTGLSEKALRKAGRPYEKIYIHPASHASYYPGASQMSLKLIFEPDGGCILGAQVVGGAGVDKRIDVLAVAQRAGMTVYDLRDLELSYAPPYGSAKDPVNYAGFVASNVLEGRGRICHTADVAHPRADQLLLDVRSSTEVAAGTIAGAVNIPVDQLRARLGELPQEKELLVFCQVGLRGYLACRTLSQRGFNCRNLSGGYKSYKMAIGTLSADASPPEPSRGAPGRVNSPPPGEKEQPGGPSAACREVDARGLQCPGPIMRLRSEMSELAAGQVIGILANDPAFPADIKAWCHSTGHRLVSLQPEGGAVKAVIAKGQTAATPPSAGPAAASGAVAPPTAEAVAPSAMSKNKTIVVFSGDFDKAMAAFIIANGAAAMGSQVTMFFTFWGLNVLRRSQAVAVRKNLVERMFGWMMPRGADRLTLSKMNMAGLGTGMIKGIMRQKRVASLPELIASAQRAGVRLVVCSMSMDLMGLRREELIDGIEEAGVAAYLDSAEAGNVNLFI